MTESIELAAVRLKPFPFLLPPRPLTVLILARDEADVLGATLTAVRRQMTPFDRLCVVADHCSDATARVAQRAGAEVFPHQDGPSQGKGAALRWWLNRTSAEADEDETIVLLDADSRPGPGLLEGLRTRLARGEVAVQARLEPFLADNSAVPVLAAFSETVEQKVFDAIRSRWGWPVRLHGTGMAFTRSVLTRAAGHLVTTAEDAELTVLLAGWGIPTSLALDVWVIDPKPCDKGGAVRQRARWFRGQIEIFRRHPASIAALLARGPAGWALLTSIFLQPKSLFVPLKASVAVMALAAWTAGLGIGWLAFGAILSAALAIDMAGLAVGLHRTDHRKPVIRALVSWPEFLGVWLASCALSVVSRRGWQRVRPASPAEPRRQEA